MVRDNLNLKDFRRPLEEALKVYERMHDDAIQFQDFPDFESTEDVKPYSARTVIPVACSGLKVGDMYAIVFRAFDGTGDDKSYGSDMIIIPSEYWGIDGPKQAVIPRKKTGVICEGFFPMFSMKPDGKVIMFATHLDELTLDAKKRINCSNKLGQELSEYLMVVNEGVEIKPKVYLTVGSTPDGTRFGDPHSIYDSLCSPQVMQVGGFLGITDPNSPLLQLEERWSVPRLLNENS